MLTDFQKLLPTETPKYLSSDFDDKIDLLKREMNYLIGKAQRFVPKPKTTTTTAKVPVNNETDADDDSAEEPTATTPASPVDEENEKKEEDPETTTPPAEDGKLRLRFSDDRHRSI